MGIIKNIIVVFVLAQSFWVSSQALDTIVWSGNNKLKWSNFKGNPKVLSKAAAVSASGITYSFNSLARGSAVEVTFQIYAFFYPYQSWYKPEICNDFVLEHEQLHFDITELFARKLRKRLKELTFSLKIKEEVSEVYKEILKELNEAQELYDWKTNFSIDREQQLEWNVKISLELKKMNSWK